MNIYDKYNNIDFSNYMFDCTCINCTNGSDVVPGSSLSTTPGLSNNNDYYEPNSDEQLDAVKYFSGAYYDTSRVAPLIFFTLNSDKEINRFRYNKVIKTVINNLATKYNFQLTVQWYFESKKKDGTSCRLHCHGIIMNVPESFYPYEGICKCISRDFHKLIGRPRMRNSISSHVEWARSNSDVDAYCKKFALCEFSERKFLQSRIINKKI